MWCRQGQKSVCVEFVNHLSSSCRAVSCRKSPVTIKIKCFGLAKIARLNFRFDLSTKISRCAKIDVLIDLADLRFLTIFGVYVRDFCKHIVYHTYN